MTFVGGANEADRGWSPGRVAAWIIILSAAVFWQLPHWKIAIRPAYSSGDNLLLFDFCQEWLSARNFRAGHPVYSPQDESLYVHTGLVPERSGKMLPWNAHPPVAVMLVLPFSLLGYENGHFAWNLFMLGAFLIALILALRLRAVPFHFFDSLWILVLLIVCSPLLKQTYQGQLNSLLVLLVVLSWLADRHDRDFAAGALIGLAAGIKIIPAFLLIYWLTRRRWRAIAGATISFLIVNGLACSLFGLDSYLTYVQVVIPSLRSFQSDWYNLSLPGLWLKLFDPAEHPFQHEVANDVIPLLRAPLLAQGLSLSSQVAIIALVAYRCRNAVTREQRDHVLGLAIIGMLLISPITWDHYLLMMLIPLIIPSGAPRAPLSLAIYRACFVVFWLPDNLFASAVLGRLRLPPAHPWQVLLGLSIQTYALLIVFILYWRSFPGSPDSRTADSSNCEQLKRAAASHLASACP